MVRNCSLFNRILLSIIPLCNAFILVPPLYPVNLMLSPYISVSALKRGMAGVNPSESQNLFDLTASMEL